MVPASTKPGNAILAFPDVCKTPTPGGPVPVPYPNQAMTGQAKTAVKTAAIGSTLGAQKVPTGSVTGTSMKGMAGQAKTAANTAVIGSRVSVQGTSMPLAGDLRIHNQGVAGRASVQDLRNQLQRLHAQIMAQPAGNPNRWHELVDHYAIATAGLYVALTSQT